MVTPGPDMSDFTTRKTVAYRVGDRVMQPMLGEGTVTSVDADHMTVDFDKRGPRTLRSNMAVLSRRDRLHADTQPQFADRRSTT
jgi:hypothetical protein